MILVVYGHVIHIWPDRGYIWTFHMPLFFFISGLIFRADKYAHFSQFALRRVIYLLIPYFLLYSLCVPIWGCYMMIKEGHITAMEILKEYALLFYGNMTASGGALWFIPCLFVVEMLYWGIHKKFGMGKSFILCLLSACAGVVLLRNGWINIPFGINQALLCMPFYSIGHIMNQYTDKVQKLKYYWSFLALIVLGGMQYLLFPLSGLDLAYNYLRNAYTYIPMALVAILFYFILSMLIKKEKILEWIGRNTLVVLAFHGFVYKAIIMLFVYLCGLSVQDIRTSYLWCITVTVITFIIHIPIVLLYNKYIPPLLNHLYNRCISRT